ncbi:uncharacterized protein C19orf44 homolog isoform X2 [Chaetodon trifascialis]|uniref:uncharacterized protein C19orf44 homolog isoform X2 n=1 Tax=Chaetodon trifascialis TaxID=109706 RepID=UPI0039929442
MWKRGGRSSALDRAQALLSAKRNSRGDAESVQPTAETQGAVGGSAKSRPAPSNMHTLLSDVSDLSSVSSAPEHGADAGASAAAAAAAAAGKSQGRERDTAKDLRPQSSLGGGGSRFLKKAPPPATNRSQSPVSRRQMQQVAEPRNVSSSLWGSQTAALNRLAQIESRIRSRQLAGQGPKSAENLTSDLGVSPPPAAQSTEASVQLSAQRNRDQSLKGTRFLKNNTAVINSNPAVAARAPQGSDVGVRSRSRAADAVVLSVGLETKSVRVVRGVSLESDEEDMRKLLGDSDSTDNSFLIPARPSSERTADKMLSKSRQRVHSTPPPAAVPPLSSVNTAPPRSPSSSSPFRFTGQAQAHFSPSVLSPSPSPPSASPSPPGRPDLPHRIGSPQRSLSSMSGRSEVLSLEELFPVGPDSEDPHSDMSAVSSEDFKINVLTLDDLVPANPGFTEETHEREARLSTLVPGSPNRRALPRLKEKDEDQQQAEDVLDYQSDFETESGTDPGYSASQVSEHLQGHGDEEEVASEVREEASDSDVSRGTAEDDYSNTFSDTSRSYISQSSDRSQTLSRSRDSRSSVSHGSRNSSHRSRRRASTRSDLKDAAVQTYTQPAGMATVGPAARMTYMDPTPVVTHTLSAEVVEALSTFNPAVFALNELLKQQLAMTRRFIESSRHLHSSLVQSLEPPNYRYTTLEDTKEYIRKHRPPKLTMEDALEEVLQEMTDC